MYFVLIHHFEERDQTHLFELLQRTVGMLNGALMDRRPWPQSETPHCHVQPVRGMAGLRKSAALASIAY